MFIISEISPQFGNDLYAAEQMIIQSKLGGADAVKLQLYPAEMFYTEPSEYLKSRELSFDDFVRLKEYGDKIGIPVFATAFDEERLKWCMELDQAYYKIAARQHNENPELVETVFSLKKPVFVSVPHDQELSELTYLDHCIYLYCIPSYPTLLEDVTFPDFKNTVFKGISDHSIGIAASVMAASYGAKYLEKHFTISLSWQRHDEKAHLGSMTEDDLKMVKKLSGDIERILN